MARFEVTRWRVIVAVFAVLALVVAVLAVRTVDGLGVTRVNADFDRTVGVYAGSDVRILGVRVGSVQSVRPEGEQVVVTLRLDDGVKVPADARAVVVAPSLVADRYVQLTPAYTGGPRLADHATIPAGRTATPVELDQLYQSITRLSDALGPNGANAQGALSSLLDTGAQTLSGNGQQIATTIQEFGKATKTLDGTSPDLFATLTNLQTFTAMLKQNDTQVRQATTQLSNVTGFLAADRQDLGQALNQLATALDQVKTFIQDNRSRLKTAVDQLTPITQSLVQARASLAKALDTTPLALDNLVNAYDPAHKTLDTRVNLNEISAAAASGALNRSVGNGAAESAGSGLALPLPTVDTPSGAGAGQ
ncbi:MCE family protein [Streptacidiphilus sp. N1-12]|uniref:MCE family protein n=2 Tax=Streptacidiphilus alkalitolerans TaxID=3342712 RepID=A0ABV6V599_9ACTN